MNTDVRHICGAFRAYFGKEPTHIVSAPGRVEICGNHTDHQHGQVLAAAVDCEVLCACRKNHESIVRLYSDGFGETSVALSDLSPRAAEQNSSAALIRGVAAWFFNHGFALGGMDIYMRSQIPDGSGLSSSAAFENAIGYAFKGLYGADADAVAIARAGQYAENVHFGKPSGLMDQCASSVGGFVRMDFADPDNPVIEKISANLGDLRLCVVNTGGSHANLTADYAAIPAEMRLVAAHFGKHYLREVSASDFESSIAALRRYGDRAVLRALHFFEENARVTAAADALKAGNTGAFIQLIIKSGYSSLALLQNIYPLSFPGEQGLTLALALASRVLDGQGAWRVHGGGFAGTILCFVPVHLLPSFTQTVEAVFGKACVSCLSVREQGGIIERL